MKGNTMDFTKIHALFHEYNAVAGELALVKQQIADSEIWPSQAMDRMTELYLLRFELRSKLNSAYRELEQSKSLWKRIFKK